MDSRDKRRTGPPAPCVCCGKVGAIMARGLREACYSRLRRYGSLEKYPPMRKAANYSLEKPAIVSRARQYEILTREPGGLSRNRACIVLGINVRTAYRYEAWIRAQRAQRKEEE